MEEARTLMLTIFVFYITLLFVSILTGHQLFTSLRKKHAECYEAIGRPIAILPPAVLPSGDYYSGSKNYSFSKLPAL